MSLKRAVDYTRNGEVAGYLISEKNWKCHIMAFSSESSVTSLFLMLSGLSKAEVKSYFRRKLTGRINGRAAVIIKEEKLFCLVYKVSLNLCILVFLLWKLEQCWFSFTALTQTDASILLCNNFPFL